MERTRHRPVADGRVSPLEGRLIGIGLSVAGLAILAAGTECDGRAQSRSPRS